MNSVNVLLILRRDGAKGLRVIVRVDRKSLHDRLIALLEQDKEHEAFMLLFKEAKVVTYFKPGERLTLRPKLTLIEKV